MANFIPLPEEKDSRKIGPIPSLQKAALVFGSQGHHRLWVLPTLEVWGLADSEEGGGRGVLLFGHYHF